MITRRMKVANERESLWVFTWTASISCAVTKRAYESFHHDKYGNANIIAQAGGTRNTTIETYLPALSTTHGRLQEAADHSHHMWCYISVPSSFCTHVGRFGLRQYLGKGYCFIKRRDEAFSITRRPILSVFWFTVKSVRVCHSRSPRYKLACGESIDMGKLYRRF